MGTWLNNDGLYVKFGTDEGVSPSSAGEYKTFGALRMAEVEIELTELPDTSLNIVNDVTVIPDNAQIEYVEVVTEVVATSGGAATLDVGLVRLDRTTELDYNGLLADVVLASFSVVGERTVYYEDAATGGALIGTILTNPGLLVASWNTAAFTAGRIVVRVFYRPEALTAN